MTRFSAVGSRFSLFDDALHGFKELFSGGGDWPFAAFGTAIAFGDVDGDGRDEVGIGSGEWGKDETLASIAFGDVDGDGRDEIGIAHNSTEGMRVQVLGVAYPIPVVSSTVLIGLGDSLTHGTMDGTNNSINTENAYLHKVADSLGGQIPLYFSQPFFDERGKRIQPFLVPTNPGVDGGDVFYLEGLEYYKRAGAEESFVSTELLADKIFPAFFRDTYDKVLYPLNIFARKPVSQIDAAL